MIFAHGGGNLRQSQPFKARMERRAGKLSRKSLSPDCFCQPVAEKYPVIIVTFADTQPAKPNDLFRMTVQRDRPMPVAITWPFQQPAVELVPREFQIRIGATRIKLIGLRIAVDSKE